MRPYLLDQIIKIWRMSTLFLHSITSEELYFFTLISMQMSKNQPRPSGESGDVSVQKITHETDDILRFIANEAWWAYLDSNQGPRPYQGRALTN